MEDTSGEIYEAFSGEIDLSSSEALTAKMVEHTYQGAERVILDISSPGGKVTPSLRLYRALRSTPFELVTRAVNEVQSMALMLYLAGDKRLAFPEATFLVHAIESTDTVVPMDVGAWRRARTRFQRRGDQLRVGEISERITYLDEKESEVRQIFEERTKLSGPEIQALVRQGQPISAADALDMGIVHQLIPVEGM